jgi:hypothetical protein
MSTEVMKYQLIELIASVNDSKTITDIKRFISNKISSSKTQQC